MSILKEIYYKYIEKDLALYFVITAELFSSLMLVASKLLQSEDEFTKPMNTLQILFVRMAITYIGTVVYLYWAKVPEAPWGPPSKRRWLIFRGVMGCIGVAGMYYPLTYISVSDSMVIMFLSPAITTVLATIVLRERVSIIEVIGGIVSLGGVILIARPSFLFGASLEVDHRVETADPHKRFLAIVCTLVGALCNGAVYVLIRFLGKELNPVITVSYYALATTIISVIGIIATPGVEFVIPDSGKQWFYLLSIGFTGFFMQLLFTAGLQREKASRTSMMMYTQIVFGLIWEYLVWRHTPNLFSWLGIFIVLGAAFFTIYYKPNQDAEVSHVRLDDGGNLEEIDIQLKDLETRTHQREVSISSDV